LRNAVRQELVARQLDEQIVGRYPVGQRLRVLDVGMGQGTQALRLARAGHQVTGLEQDAKMVAAAREALSGEPEGIRERVRIIEGDGRDTGVHFLPGSFDLVLCHGVLMYVAEPDPLLAGLARMLAPGGLLSLLVRNADALAMRPGLSGDWTSALAAFDSTAYRNRLGLDVRPSRASGPPCRPGTACGSSATRPRTGPRFRATSTHCWPPRSGPGAPIRIAGSRRCCICAGCAASAFGRSPEAGHSLQRDTRGMDSGSAAKKDGSTTQAARAAQPMSSRTSPW
jgi:SAM-dependent methyltransferase